MLGKYSAKAQTALSSMLKAIVDGKKNPSIGYNATRSGKVALSGHLLRNSSTGPIPSPQSPTSQHPYLQKISQLLPRVVEPLDQSGGYAKRTALNLPL